MTCRKFALIIFSLSICVIAAASCGRGQAASRPTAATANADGPGVITGIAKFEGEPPGRAVVRMGGDPQCMPKHPFSLPGRNVTATLSEATIVNEQGGIANVFVHVRDGLGNRVYAAPTTRVVLDQSGCQYEPHVFGVFTGQPIDIKNSDPTPHNVDARPHTNAAFNFSQQPSTAPITKTRPANTARYDCRWQHVGHGGLPVQGGSGAAPRRSALSVDPDSRVRESSGFSDGFSSTLPESRNR